MTVKFPCPRCGQPIEAVDQAVGQTAACTHCGSPVTVPGGGLPVLQGSPKPRGGSWGLPVILGIVAVSLLVCCGLLGLLITPAYFSARDSQARMLASNNVKQIVIALQMYAQTHGGQLPPAVVADGDGKPLYSGRVLLLPYLEQLPLYERFDKTKAWDSPENRSLSQTTISTFQSPKNRGRPGGCDFVFVSGPGAAFEVGKSVNFGDIRDGLSQTLFVVETTSGPDSWAAPGDWDASTGNLAPGFHKNRTVVGRGDGSVVTLQTVPPFQYTRQITTIAGGEAIGEY